LLGPETVASESRVRTLGLGSTVRLFNDLAVPGMGAVWFGKQLLLATLGVAVAEGARRAGERVRNIEVANAVEALACWLALNEREWKSEPRLRGATRMAEKTDLAFAAVRRPGFYVTTPMRQATVQPLRALGFVAAAGERFNTFACAEHGFAFISEACDEFNPYNRSVLDHLVSWAAGGHNDVTSSYALRMAISPLEPLPQGACDFLRERLVQGTGTAARRRQALAWVDQLRGVPGRRLVWDDRPALLDAEHWRDMRAGALFFATRAAAIALLDRIEEHIAHLADQRMSLDAKLPEPVTEELGSLRVRARAFLDLNHDPSPSCSATAFCRECVEPHDARLVEKLLAREGRVLRLRDRDIVPGISFRGSPAAQTEPARSVEDAGGGAEAGSDLQLPEFISHRVRNLFLLNLDLHSELTKWLGGEDSGEGDT
jgi:hypothetical protein